jgi:hypothetical protein
MWRPRNRAVRIRLTELETTHTKTAGRRSITLDTSIFPLDRFGTTKQIFLLAAILGAKFTTLHYLKIAQHRNFLHHEI